MSSRYKYSKYKQKYVQLLMNINNGAYLECENKITNCDKNDECYKLENDISINVKDKSSFLVRECREIYLIGKILHVPQKISYDNNINKINKCVVTDNVISQPNDFYDIFNGSKEYNGDDKEFILYDKYYKYLKIVDDFVFEKQSDTKRYESSDYIEESIKSKKEYKLREYNDYYEYYKKINDLILSDELIKINKYGNGNDVLREKKINNILKHFTLCKRMFESILNVSNFNKSFTLGQNQIFYVIPKINILNIKCDYDEIKNFLPEDKNKYIHVVIYNNFTNETIKNNIQLNYDVTPYAQITLYVGAFRHIIYYFL